jgi:O-antigen/teichoic acid export membrane protein
MSKIEELYSEVGKKISVVWFAKILIAPQGLLTLPILTKALGPHDYGVWSLIQVIIHFLPLFALLQLPQSIVRFLSGEKDKQKIQDGIYSCLTIVVMVSLFEVIILITFGFFFFEELNQIILFIAWIIPLICISSILKYYLLSAQKQNLFALIIVLETYSKIFFFYIFLYIINLGLIGAILSILLSNLLIDVLMLIFTIKNVGIAKPKFTPIKEYLHFSIPLMPLILTVWIVSSSDRIIIGFFKGATHIGFYSAGYNFGNLLFVFIMIIGVAIRPILVKLYTEKKNNDLKAVLSHTYKYYLIITIPSIFGIALLSKPLLTILTLPEIANQAYIIAPITAIAILMQGSTRFYEEILFLMKKTTIISKIFITAAILNLILNIIFIPFFGIISAAITTLIAYTTAFLLTNYYASKHIIFRKNYKITIKAIIASIVMSIFIIGFYPTSLSQTIIIIIISSVIYFTILFLTKAISKKEFQLLKYMIKKSKKD